MRVGAIATFLNPTLLDSEIGPIVEDLSIRAVIHEGEDEELGGATGVSLPADPSLEITPMPAEAFSFGERAAASHDISSILLTGGSTGRPKYVGVPHAAYTTKGTLNALRLGLAADDRAFCVMPLFHIGAQVEALAPMIAAGASVHLAPRFSSSRLWEELLETNATYFHSTGSLLQMALHRGEPSAELPLRRIVASLREDLVERLRTLFPQVDLITVYGMTECPLGTLGTPSDTYRPGWVGYPYGPGQIRIVDLAGKVVEDGEDGEIQFNNPSCTKGYIGVEDRELFTADGWLRTGDRGFLAGGGVFLSGRIKAMIRRSGENIWPTEVEEAILRHQDVADAAAVAHPDPITDEEVRVFVVPVRGAVLDLAEVRNLASQHLAPYKLPRYMDIVDHLPRTAANKVDKQALIAGHPDPQWDAKSSGERS